MGGGGGGREGIRRAIGAPAKTDIGNFPTRIQLLQKSRKFEYECCGSLSPHSGRTFSR